MVKHQSCKLKIEGSIPFSDLSLIKRINKVARNSVNYSMSRHCAVIFSPSGQFVCMANNHHEKHSEMRVLQKFFSRPKYYGKGIGYMLVVRVNKTGKWNYSKPCQKCKAMLAKRNIRVVHS